MPSKKNSKIWDIGPNFLDPLPPLAIWDIRNWDIWPALRPPPSLLNLGHISIFYEFSMIIKRKSRIETVIANSVNCQIFYQSHQNSSLHNLSPPETKDNHLIILKYIKLEHSEQKFIAFFLWQRPSDPLPPRVLVPIKISKKLGLRPDPLPPFGPMSQILLFFFEGIPYSNWCME